MEPLLNFMQRESGLLQEQEIPLDSSGRCLEVLAQPGAGYLPLFHEDPENLAQADQFRLCATITSHVLPLSSNFKKNQMLKNNATCVCRRGIELSEATR